MTRYPLPPDAPIPDDVIDALTMTPGLDRVALRDPAHVVTLAQYGALAEFLPGAVARALLHPTNQTLAPSAHPRTASQPGAPPLAGTGERVPGVPDGTPAARRGVGTA